MSINDIEELCEYAAPWNLYLRKLDKGKVFYSELDQLACNDLILYRAKFSGILEQTGEPPEGMRTIWVPADDAQNFLWRNNDITRNSIGLFPTNGELHSVSKPGFHVYVFSVPEQDIISTAHKLGHDWMEISKKIKEHLTVEQTVVDELRETLQQMLELGHRTIHADLESRMIKALKTSFLERFVRCILSYSDSSKQHTANRTRIFKQFQEYVHGHLDAPFSSSDLCAYVGASERSLQYALKSLTGMNPLQYAKSLKMNMIREKLLGQHAERMQIKQLALEYGFWHAPQFANDYKKQFGELPSETLAVKKRS